MSTTVNLSRRELRLMSRRILVAYEAPTGLIPAAADALVAGMALGLNPLERFMEHDPALVAELRQHRSPSWSIVDNTLTIDGHGQWAPMLVPAIGDIITIAAAREPIARVRLENMVGAHLAAAVRGRLIGIALEADGPTEWLLRFGEDETYRDAEARLVHEGVETSREEWLALYRMSLQGLAPESEESYKHAGYIGADGELISGMDDDHDIEAAVHELGRVG